MRREYRRAFVGLFILAAICITTNKQVRSALALEAAARDQSAPRYRDRALPIEQRVADLLGRMTLDEKVAQLECLWMRKPQVMNAPGNFDVDHGDFSEDRATVVMKNGIGEIARQRERKDPRQGAIFANAVQKFLAEKTRLGIPALFHDEILHGNMAYIWQRKKTRHRGKSSAALFNRIPLIGRATSVTGLFFFAIVRRKKTKPQRGPSWRIVVRS